MLTGARAFEGEETTDVLAAVIRADPDWRKLPAETPRTIRQLLRRCLEKDRRERLPDIAMARIEIKDALAVGTETETVAESGVVRQPAGTRPLWNRNGQELFFLSPPGAVMRVGVERAPTWLATVPTMLIKEGYFTVAGGNPGRTYDVSPDGQRFLLVRAGGGSNQRAAPTSIIVVQHWADELKRLVPTR